MKAQIAGGTIGGLPVKGGAVSLEAASTAAIIHASTGLVREVANVGLIGGGLGLAGILLTSLLRTPQAPVPLIKDSRRAYLKVEEDIGHAFRYFYGIKTTRERLDWFIGYPRAEHRSKTSPSKSPDRYQRELDEIEKAIKEKTFLPLSSVCVITTTFGRVIGICLEDELSFRTAEHTQKVRIHDIVAFEHSECNGETLGLILRDSSIFESITLETPISFATLAGVVEVRSEEIKRIRGINHEEAAELRLQLLAGLQETSADLLEAIGLDLIAKYFSITPIIEKESVPLLAASGLLSRNISVTVVDRHTGAIVERCFLQTGESRELRGLVGCGAVLEVGPDVSLHVFGALCQGISPAPEVADMEAFLKAEYTEELVWRGDGPGMGAAIINDRYTLMYTRA